MSVHDLGRYARRQHALFTYEQALAAGISHDTVVRNLQRKIWEEPEPQVYRALPAARASFEQRLLALVLSVGGAAYGRSAVALYGLDAPPPLPEVLVVRSDRNRSRAGLHSTRSLLPTELAVVRGIQATMPGRAVIDACATLPQARCCELVDAAVVKRLVRPQGLARRAEELNNAKRPGCAKVLHALSSQHPQLDRARNEWEALSVRLAGEHGLPEPVPNLAVITGGQRRVLDLAWPDVKVVFEFDGYQPHTVRAVFDDDRVRQNALVADGWLVFRATSRTLRRDSRAVFAPIAAAIHRRGHEMSQICEVS